MVTRRPQHGTWRALDERAIQRIVTMPDPVGRNVAITLGYHLLAMEVAGVIGRENASWLCFGQWASAEAGRAIRGESVPALVRPLIGEAVAAAVAAGNAAVFGDVAPPFIRFVREFSARPNAQADRPESERVLQRLLDHPQVTASPDLQRAFRAYTDALLMKDDPDPTVVKLRAERVLVANASIGAHEQVVADPHIRDAIPGRWIVAIAATAHLGIRIPDGVLNLNRDVPAPAYLDGDAFPPALRTLADPDARALAIRFGQDLDSTRHSDAPDWESYHERMGFIYNLLRAYQQDPAMFVLPDELAAVETRRWAAP